MRLGTVPNHSSSYDKARTSGAPNIYMNTPTVFLFEDTLWAVHKTPHPRLNTGSQDTNSFRLGNLLEGGAYVAGVQRTLALWRGIFKGADAPLNARDWTRTSTGLLPRDFKSQTFSCACITSPNFTRQYTKIDDFQDT